MATEYASETVLLHSKYLIDERDADLTPGASPVQTGTSLRIVARRTHDGRPAASVTLFRREHQARASGRTYRVWKPDHITSFTRTKQGMVVRRVKDRKVGFQTTHLFADDGTQLRIADAAWGHLHWILFTRDRALPVEGPALDVHDRGGLTGRIEEQLQEHLGPLPTFADRFPLLDPSQRPTPAGYMPFLDARDHAQVAKNLFGVRQYRRPLEHQVKRLHPEALAWFALFRGLVPIEWIIDAMRNANAEHDQRPTASLKNLRRLLRDLPQPVLRRILNEPQAEAHLVLADATRQVWSKRGVQLRDIGTLPALIQARGQKHIRSSRDLEHLITQIPFDEPVDRRRDAALRTADRERRTMWAIDAYNKLVRELPEAGLPEATWQLWHDEEFRARAEAAQETHREQLERRRHEEMTRRQREYEERRREQERQQEQEEEQRRLERLRAQAERAAWATETAKALHRQLVDTAAGSMTLVVADARQQLVEWGAAMGNCIGGYASELGLDVLAAVVDADGAVKLNIQITHAGGVQQFLGKHNQDAARALGGEVAQQIADRLFELGVQFGTAGMMLGLKGLRVPGRELAAA